MVKGITADTGGGSAGAIDLKFSDGSGVQMAKDFAFEIDGALDRLNASFEGGKERYASGSSEYRQIANLIDNMDDAAINSAQGKGTEKLDTEGVRFMENLSWLGAKQQRIAEDSGDGDMSIFADMQREFSAAVAPFQRQKTPGGGIRGSGGGDAEAEAPGAKDRAAPGGGDAPAAVADASIEDVRELLGEAKASSNSSTKSARLSEAIAALIAAIRGMSEPAEPSPADALRDKVSELTDRIAGGSAATPPASPKAAEAPAAAPAADAPPRKGATDAADAAPSAEGDAAAPEEAAAPRRTTFEPSVEYNAGDSLTLEYKDPATDEWVAIDTKTGGGDPGAGDLADVSFEGAPEDLEVRLRNNTTGQVVGMDDEQARVTERADGSLVIAFEDRANGDNDFNDAVLTLTPVETGDAGGAPAEGPGDVAGGAPSDGPPRASFDASSLLELLEALMDAIGLVDGSEELSDEQRDALFEKLGAVLEGLTDAIDPAGEGGASVTAEEVATIAETVEGLNEGLEDGIEDGGDKNETLDAMTDGLMALLDLIAPTAADAPEEDGGPAGDGDAGPDTEVA